MANSEGMSTHDALKDARNDDYPFLEYASLYWKNHVLHATGLPLSMTDSRKMARLILDPETAGDLQDIATRLIIISHHMETKYRSTGIASAIAVGIGMAELAVYITPAGHINLPGWLDTLSTQLMLRFEQTGQMEDLDKAIRAINDAIDATPPGSPSLATRQNLLGIGLGYRFRTNKIEV